MSKTKYIIFLFYVGLTIRLGLIAFPGFRIDVDSWFSWALRLNQVGFGNFYNDNYFSDYTPGFLYVLSFLGFLKNSFDISVQSFYSILKVPAILAEIVLGFLIYKQIANHSTRFYGVIAAAFILLNPAFIFNSSIWGQIEGILALALYLSVFYLKKERLILASFILSIAFLIKPQTIALFPVFFFYLLKNLNIKNLAKLTIPFFITTFALSLPFFLTQPLTGLPSLIIKTAAEYPFTSLFAYNLWGIVGFWIKDNTLWNSLPYQYWSYIIYGVYLLILAYFYLKGRLSLYALSALSVLAFFFLPTRVHERYLYPGLIFLILLSGFLKSKLILLLTLILSFINFLNLYYVYIYYNEVYLKLPKLFYNPLVYSFLDSNGQLLSIISAIIFGVISIVIIKSSYVNKEN